MVPHKPGDFGAGRPQTRTLRDERTEPQMTTGVIEKARNGRVRARYQSAKKLRQQLARIAPADDGGQPQRPTDQALHVSGGVPVVVSNEDLRAKGIQLLLHPVRRHQDFVEAGYVPRVLELIW